MLPGPEGGDLQIGGLVASDEVNLVVFLRDPLTAQPHDPDISALLRMCDAWKTLIKAEKNVEAIKEAIRQNSNVAIYLFRKQP